MKSTIKLFLISALFVSGIFANEGDLGNGGYTCQSECVNSPENTEITCAENFSQTNSDDSLLSTVQGYLNDLFGTGNN